MKRLLMMLFCFCSLLYAEEKLIVVVTASYNNVKWLQKNLDSIFSQEYKNWHLIYCDDCSPDRTGDYVERYVAQKGMQSHVTLIKNKKRVGALANQFKATYMAPDEAIIAIVDGDDWLSHSRVFQKINEVYQDENVWMSYGQFMYASNTQTGFCKETPEHIIKANAFRSYSQPSHLRTYYAGLFKRIQLVDLMKGNEFFKMSNDIATMFPIIEMARNHFVFIPYVLYIYNDMNQINNHRLNWKHQFANAKLIKKKKPYDKIKSPFWYKNNPLKTRSIK